MTDQPVRGRGRGRAAPALWMRIGGAVLVGYVLATLVAGLFLAARLRHLGNEDLRRRLDDTLALLQPSAARALSAPDAAGFRDVTAAAGAMDRLRVTLIRADGEVVAESERSLPLADHGDRPEFRAALATGSGEALRESATVGEPMLYVARRLGTAAQPLGVLRVSVPIAVRERWSADLSALLLLAFATGIPVLALVGWYTARRIARPLERMTAAAAQMAAGDFASLPIATRDDEAGRLSEALRRMGKELSTTLGASESDRAELAAIIGSMDEGVVALDRFERVLRANEGAADVLDLEAVPAPGTPLGDLVHVPGLAAALRRALGGAHVRDVDIEPGGPTGRVLSLSASPIRGAPTGATDTEVTGATDTGVTGAVLVIRDVTSLRRLERARLDFVANVSHELRTPVAAVMGALETVQDVGHDEDPEACDQLLAMAHRNAVRMSSIVNDLLSLSAIETEETCMERASVPLLRSIRSAASALAVEAQQRSIVMVMPPSDQPEIAVHGHAGRLELVWVNLIGNAIKYSGQGGRVSIEVTSDASLGEARVDVRDTGCGIPRDALPRIFERFYRVDKARSRDRGGTGLGLAIVKHIVRAHRGRVEVESAPDEGSTFTVRLPLCPPDSPQESSQNDDAVADGAPGA